MAHISGTFTAPFRSVHPTRGRLSDDLVGHVLQRAPGARTHSNVAGGWNLPYKSLPNDTTTRSAEPKRISPPTDKLPSKRTSTRSTQPSLTLTKATAPSSTPKLHRMDKKVTRKRREVSRQEQCKLNQARYRSRQRVLQQQLEENVKQLRSEVDHLKREYGCIRPDRKSKPSPWAVVAEVFRLLEDSIWRTMGADSVNYADTQKNFAFLQESFSPDAAVGDLSGVDVLEELRRFPMNFGSPQLQLQRIDSVAPGVLTATARLSATVTELTFRNVFPSLVKEMRRGSDDERMALRERLSNQRLECSCTVNFLFDEETGRVERVEPNVDFTVPLSEVLGNLENVAIALLKL
ncbi:hypothetical protein PRNP1_001407 [Phytophthora ramorum]